jgi:hypothetical protein
MTSNKLTRTFKDCRRERRSSAPAHEAVRTEPDASNESRHMPTDNLAAMIPSGKTGGRNARMVAGARNCLDLLLVA